MFEVTTPSIKLIGLSIALAAAFGLWAIAVKHEGARFKAKKAAAAGGMR
jgi:hypothetical protein